jgi:NADH dehydrogenase FAD-containing subunit
MGDRAADTRRVSGRPRIVVLGGGFAGLAATLKLGKADAEVVLLDRHDYHPFQPLLYPLATGSWSRAASATRCATSSTTSQT